MQKLFSISIALASLACLSAESQIPSDPDKMHKKAELEEKVRDAELRLKAASNRIQLAETKRKEDWESAKKALLSLSHMFDHKDFDTKKLLKQYKDDPFEVFNQMTQYLDRHSNGQPQFRREFNEASAQIDARRDSVKKLDLEIETMKMARSKADAEVAQLTKSIKDLAVNATNDGNTCKRVEDGNSRETPTESVKVDDGKVQKQKNNRIKKIYLLKNGEKIESTLSIDTDDGVSIKQANGKMITIKKEDISEIVDP